MAEPLSTDPWEGVLAGAEQQTGLQPGLLRAIAQQENVAPRHYNPLGLSSDVGVKTFDPQSAIAAIQRQAALLTSKTGPYAEFARTGDINALAKVYSPPGARNDPYGTNVTEAGGIKANLEKRFLSADPSAGMPKATAPTPQATLPTPGIPSPTLAQEVGPPAPVAPPQDDLRTMEAGLGADPGALEDFRKAHPQLYSAIANAAGGAYDVGKEFIQGLATPSGLAGLVSPFPGAYEELKQSFDTLRGQPPPSPIAEAETTPPYSRERFKAGLGEIANVLMAGAIGKQITAGPKIEPARPSPETVATPTAEAPATPLEPPSVEGYARVAPTEPAPPAAAEAPPAEAAKPAVTLTERTLPEGDITGTHAVDIANPEGDNIGYIGGNLTDQGFEVNISHIDRGQRGKGFYQDAIQQMADKYGQVKSDVDMAPAAEAAWQKVGAEKQSDGSYVLKAAKPEEVIPSAIEEGQQQESDLAEHSRDEEGGPSPSPERGGGVEPSPPVQAQEAVAPEPEPTSIKNVVTEAERAKRGIPAAEEALRRDFPTEMSEADAREQADPGTGERLVEEINRKPRALDGTEVAQLLREQIKVQGEYDRAIDAVNSAKNPEDLVNAKIRLSEARDKAQAVYDADKRAGTAGGRGLNARKMMADQNYNLVRMEARFRASRNGKALTEPQARVVNAMHDKIKLAADKADAAARAAASHAEFQQVLDAAKRAPKEKGFLAKQADAARQRIIARRGRLNVGVDPGALVDEAIIGADHIGRGLTKFGEWSRQMITDFGERIRPYLKNLWERARAYHATTAEAKLATYKKGLATRTEKLRAKIEAGDLTRARREKTQLDAEAFKMRAEYQRLRDQFEMMVEKERLRNRSAPERVADTFVKAERALKLTGITTLGKLAGAGATRLIQTPIERVLQSALSVPLRRIAREAPLEGGLSLAAEKAAHTTGIAKGVKYIPKILSGKAIPEESIFARRDVRPAADTLESILDIPGKAHGAIKSIPKEVERARATRQLEDFARRKGQDLNDPATRQAIGEAADQQAKRAIFMQDNVLSSAWNNAMRSLESNKKFPVAGKTLATMGRFLLPIVKVPTNIAFETATHLGGTVSGTAKLLQVMHRGLKTIKPEEADMIMRHYTKGMVGAGLFLTGWFNSDKFGGFYQKNEKRKPGEPAFGEAKFGDVTVPRWLLHAPAFIVLQAGATAHRVYDTIEPKTGEKKGAGKASLAVAGGIARDIPFVSEMGVIDSMLSDEWSGTKARGRLLTGSLVPTGVSNVAQWTDPLQEPQYRSPQNELDYLKMAIPGLREQVPLHGQGKGPLRRSAITRP